MNRSLGKWTLPQPTDMKEEEEWVAIPKIARTVPFGYVVDENHPDVLAHRLCGAGNGGFFLIFSKKEYVNIDNKALKITIDNTGPTAHLI